MRRSRWRVPAVVALALLFASTAAASDVLLPLQLDVEVNGEPRNVLVGFEERKPGRLAAKRVDLAALGLGVPGGRDDDVIALDDLPGVKHVYDEGRQMVKLQIAADAFLPQVFDAASRDGPRIPATSGTGAVLDYALVLSGQSSSEGGTEALSYAAAGNFRATVFSAYGVGETGVIAGTQLVNEAPAIRLDTAWTHTDDESMVEYRYGDNISGGLSWSRPIRFGGFRMQRNFALQPDYVVAPLPVITGSAALPSTVDVYVDNIKAYSRSIGPGPFTISNVPITGGGLARIVIRDSAGRVTESVQPFYTSPVLLRDGLLDYSVDVGVPRRNFGALSFDYDLQPIGSASGRYGWNERLTLEGHAEAGLGTVTAGVGAVFSPFKNTLMNVAMSASRFDDSEAARAFAGLSTKWFGANISLRSERVFGDFVDLASASSATADDIRRTAKLLTEGMAKATDIASVSFPVPLVEGSLSLSAIRSWVGEDDSRHTMSAYYTRNVGQATSLYASAFHEMEDRSTTFFVGLSRVLGENMIGAASLTHDRKGAGVTAEVAKNPGSEVGAFGWRTTVTRGATERISAAATYRASAVDVDVLAVANRSDTWVSATAAGALISFGGDVRAVNRVDDAFAIVDVGAPGIDVLANNRPVGKTGDDGRAFVTGLLPYHANKITIDPTILPPDTEASVTSSNVNPRSRSGVIVDMKVKPAQPSALVQFVLPEGEPVPAGAVGRLADNDAEEFIVGYDGQAFISRLSENNTAVIQYEDKSCTSTFSFRARPGEQVQVNSVLCK